MATNGNTTTDTTAESGLKARVRSVVSRLRGGSDDENPDRERRAFLRKTGATGLAVAAGAAATSGEAAAAGETCSISRTDDRWLPWSTGGDYGGWGGADYWGTGGGVSNTPVVFVHGNGGDACNWNTIANYLRNNGYSGDELWAISFSEYTTNHDEMKQQLDDFVQNVMAETGASEVNVVAHSLGVTGVRYWMEDWGRFNWVDEFVGFGGANHGVCVCPGCFDTTLGADYGGIMGAGEACQFIAIQCFSVPGHPLYELNLPTETPGSVSYHMYRGLYDPLYACNVYSPYLAGAEDNDYLWTDHLGLLQNGGSQTLTAVGGGDTGWW